MGTHTMAMLDLLKLIAELQALKKKKSMEIMLLTAHILATLAKLAMDITMRWKRKHHIAVEKRVSTLNKKPLTQDLKVKE